MSGQKAESKNKRSASTDPTAAWQPFGQAYYELVQDLQETTAAAGQNAAEEGRRYSEALQKIQTEAAERMQAAYLSYEQTVKESAGKKEEARAFQESYSKYVAEVQEVQAESQKSAEKAWDDCHQAMAKTPAGEAYREAYRVYMKRVKEAWSGLDTQAVDPVALAAVGQALTAAAWQAGSVFAGSGD